MLSRRVDQKPRMVARVHALKSPTSVPSSDVRVGASAGS